MPFLSPIKDFTYRPYVKKGEIVSGLTILVNELVWLAKAEGELHTVPRGAVSDGMSRPWITAGLLKKLGKGQRADRLHDYFYQTRIHHGKRWADKQYLLAMLSDGTPKHVAYTAYWGVAAFGAFAWYFNKPLKVRKVG